MKKIVLISAIVALFAGCKAKEVFNDAVPSYPVSIRIDTNIGQYVHFTPDNINAYIIVNKDGIYFNKQLYPLPINTSFGYGGTVINVNTMNQYSAFDMCCPKCLKPNQPIEVDGGYANCPGCGEAFELMNGLGTPSRGISQQSLRRFNTLYSNGVVQVNN